MKKQLIINIVLNLIGVLILYGAFDCPKIMSTNYLVIILTAIIFNVAGIRISDN